MPGPSVVDVGSGMEPAAEEGGAIAACADHGGLPD